MERKVSLKTDSLSQEFRALRSNLLKEEKGEKSKNPETPRILRSRNGNLDTPESANKRKRAETENRIPAKRERTVTWAGKTKPSAKEAGKTEQKTTRKSTGGLNAHPMGKLRRAKITLKGK